MSTFNQKIQQALDKVDLAADFAKNRRWAKFQNFFIKHGFEVTWSGFLLLPLWLFLFGNIVQDQSVALMFSMLPAMSVFAIGDALTNKATQKLTDNGLTLSNSKMNVALGMANAEFKLDVLKLAQNTQLKTEFFDQLVRASERDDVPQGWWDVVKNVLQEEWDAQKHNHEIKMKAQYQKKMEQELKNFGNASDEVIHIQEAPKEETEEVVRTNKPITKHINL